MGEENTREVARREAGAPQLDEQRGALRPVAGVDEPAIALASVEQENVGNEDAAEVVDVPRHAAHGQDSIAALRWGAMQPALSRRLPPGPRHTSLVTTWHWLRRPYDFLDELAAKYDGPFTLE